MFYGDPSLVWKQLVAIVSTYIFVGIASFIIIKAIQLFMPIRVDEEAEKRGLDITLHGEHAYGQPYEDAVYEQAAAK
ncbi:hypothetical protein MAHJHV51_56690 [Mycobacterium avium subsp. hominissuis]